MVCFDCYYILITRKVYDKVDFEYCDVISNLCLCVIHVIKGIIMFSCIVLQLQHDKSYKV